MRPPHMRASQGRHSGSKLVPAPTRAGSRMPCRPPPHPPLPQQLSVRLIRGEVSVPPQRLGGGLRQPRVLRAPTRHLRVAVDVGGALPREELLELERIIGHALAAPEGDVLECGVRSPSWASISWAAGIGGAIGPTRP
eukprot:scaffold11216_cov126-Isochrysis_galbana.AAC.2